MRGLSLLEGGPGCLVSSCLLPSNHQALKVATGIAGGLTQIGSFFENLFGCDLFGLSRLVGRFCFGCVL